MSKPGGTGISGIRWADMPKPQVCPCADPEPRSILWGNATECGRCRLMLPYAAVTA
jgi:hypothetical protein